MYYIFILLTPDLASIRRGSITIAECEGMDWTKKQDFHLVKEMCVQLAGSFPIKVRTTHYHTSTFFNIMMSIAKKTFPDDTSVSFVAGLTCDSRLDSICLVPTAEVAAQRLLSSIQKTMKKRFDNEASFALSDADNMMVNPHR